MTKAIALVLGSLTLIACAAETGTSSEQSSRVANAEGPTAAATAGDDAPTDCPSPGPAKTAGLLEKCAGDYECNGGRKYGANGKEVSLHFDGTVCRVAENPGDDLILEPSGRVVLDGKNVGAWTGDSVAFEYTHDYGSGPIEYRCRPLPATAR